MKTRTRHLFALTTGLLAAGVTMIASPAMAGDEEGGYVYNGGEDRFVDNVYNFIKHFSYNQYYWCQSWLFNSSNNSYVDNMDFSYYSGHGSNWYIGMGPGASTSGVNLRWDSQTRWGDTDLEFIVFQSCAVIPAARDRSDGDWWTAWVRTNGPFEGLHQAIGYRTNSYSGNGISNNYGTRIAGSQRCWQAWFSAVNDERSWWRGSDYPGYASAVMHPSAEYDTYYSFGSDPDPNHTSLRIWYQY